jgi:hypothetical protein
MLSLEGALHKVTAPALGEVGVAEKAEASVQSREVKDGAKNNRHLTKAERR